MSSRRKAVTEVTSGECNLPLNLRLRWIVQLAEGIAFLHSKNIVWVDCHLDNVLLTDDLDVVLGDFAGSRIDDERQSVLPPPCYYLPHFLEHNVVCPKIQDLFAFGTCAFILLCLRLPHRSISYSTDLSITEEDLSCINQRHEAHDFDSVSEESFPGLAEVVQKCWRLQYLSTEEFVEQVQEVVTKLQPRNLKLVRGIKFDSFGSILMSLSQQKESHPSQLTTQNRRVHTFLLSSLIAVLLALVYHAWTKPEIKTESVQ